jgi:hypothetical protein
MADDGDERGLYTTSREWPAACAVRGGRRTQSKTLDREKKSRPLSHPAASGLTLSGGGTDSGQRERGVECGD